MNAPLLVTFVGVPGSGKTYFATRLTERLHAVRLNSDAMRLAIFGSLDAIEKAYQERPRQVNSYVFGAMDYVARELLHAGTSVVYEGIQRTKSDRTHMEQLAGAAGARIVLVSVTVDEEVAINRTINRPADRQTRQFDEAKAREVVTHFREHTEPFDDLNYVINIDGTHTFAEQYASFQAQLSQPTVS